MFRRNLFKEKKGDVESIIYAVVFMAIIGIVFFLISHLNNEIFTELDEQLNVSDWNDTEAYTINLKFKQKNASKMWDFAFLGIVFAVFIALGLNAYAVRISPVFYWIYALFSLIVLALAVMLSNVWQELAAESDFAVTITQFPITNTLLGTYYPTLVMVLVVLFMIILFGKPKQGRVV